MKTTFSVLSMNYSSNRVVFREALFKEIGWDDLIGNADYLNTCAIRMSLALIKSGVPVRGRMAIKKGPHKAQLIEPGQAKLAHMLAGASDFGEPEKFKTAAAVSPPVARAAISSLRKSGSGRSIEPLAAQSTSLPTYRIGPVGEPVGEPVGGSRLTASAAVPPGSLPRRTTVASCAEIRPSERGAPLPGTAHSSSARSACTATWVSGRIVIARPSPLMLATNDAGATAPAGVPVALNTTTSGGCAGPGLASNTEKPIAATVAMAVSPRHNASCAHHGVGFAAEAAAAPPMRASIFAHTPDGGASGARLKLSGIKRVCQASTAPRRFGCAGNSRSKRRRAGPRKVPVT